MTIIASRNSATSYAGSACPARSKSIMPIPCSPTSTLPCAKSQWAKVSGAAVICRSQACNSSRIWAISAASSGCHWPNTPGLSPGLPQLGKVTDWPEPRRRRLQRANGRRDQLQPLFHLLQGGYTGIIVCQLRQPMRNCWPLTAPCTTRRHCGRWRTGALPARGRHWYRRPPR